METLLSKLEAFRSGMTPESGTDIYLSAPELETLISLLKGSNQPSGEGVKSVDEYILYAQNACAIEKGYDNFETLSLAASIGRGTFSKVHVDWAYVIGASIKEALTAQARDMEMEILAFKEFYSNAENYQVSADKHLWDTDEGTVTTAELLTQFRNDRSKPKE